MNIQQYISHPEYLDRTSLYELRALTAQYPYYQPARLLLLKNLYLLHDSTFDEELRRAAMYISDRRKLFDLVEAAHYQLHPQEMEDKVMGDNGSQANNPQDKPSSPNTQEPSPNNKPSSSNTQQPTPDRTTKLIDDFLEQIPQEDDKPSSTDKEKPTPHRKPTVADATGDYMAYLVAMESEEEKEEEEKNSPHMKGQDLIDDFLNNDDGKMELKDEPEYEPDLEEEDNDDDSGYFTETLARIYIKQGRYSKALEIIRRLNLIYPKKNRYFADQIRFLEKLIINNNNNKE